MNPQFKSLKGSEAIPHLEELARLRMKVFREFPYLYEGDLEYEKKYLNTYFSSPNSFVGLCEVNQRVVGACTAILLADEQMEFQEPFLKNGNDPNTICYFGESVLEKEFRGHGIGNRFMTLRLSYAKSLPRVKTAAFCAVLREKNHPMMPPEYRPLDSFWEKWGFQKISGLTTEYAWKDLGQTAETKKQMQFWSKQL